MPESARPEAQCTQWSGEERREGQARIAGLELDVSLRQPMRPCSPACAGACCWGACVMTRAEIRRIEARLSEILPLLRPAAARVVRAVGFVCAKQGVYRPDFAPEDEARWSRIVGGRCVFYNEFELGRCALHELCARQGLPAMALKPLTCFLFPISKPIRGRVVLRRWAELSCLQPQHGQAALPAYRACRAELERLLGEPGYAALLAAWGEEG